jgi:3-oxoadipate enol-lactonase
MANASVNGTTLWYEEAGDGPPVVLIHSTLLDSRQWDPQLPALAAAHRTIRYDLRWFGRSERTPGSFSEVEDLRALLDHLGIEQAALAGSSGGGAIELDFALTYPQRVTALVTVASGLRGYPGRNLTEEQEAAIDAAVEAGDLVGSVELELRIWAPLGDDGLYSIARENAHVNGPVEAEPVPLDPPAAGRLGEIRAPALVITGDQDVPRINEIGDALERGIADTRRLRFADSDHFPNRREPDRFNEAVLGFLS